MNDGDRLDALDEDRARRRARMAVRDCERTTDPCGSCARCREDQMMVNGVHVSIAPECEGSGREVQAFGLKRAECPRCRVVQNVTRRRDRDGNVIERIARHDEPAKRAA